jgi:hypothetical protein
MKTSNHIRGRTSGAIRTAVAFSALVFGGTMVGVATGGPAVAATKTVTLQYWNTYNQADKEFSTMAKVIASEHAGKAADLGMQMLGGMGYALETNMQRYWRDVRLYRIGPITSEMARNVVAESYGMPRSF